MGHYLAERQRQEWKEQLMGAVSIGILRQIGSGWIRVGLWENEMKKNNYP